MQSKSISGFGRHVFLIGMLLALSWSCEAGTISVSPATADAGTVGLNLTSYQKLFYNIKNTGTTNLNLTGVTSAASEFIIDQPASGQLPVVIPPGGSYLLAASFKPTVAGARSSVIAIASDDPVNPNITVTGTGYGGIEQSIRLAPAIPFEIESGQGIDLRANVTFDNGAQGVALLNWTSSNPSVAGAASGADSLVFGTAVPTGKVSGLSSGTSTISVSGVTNPGARATVNVTVVPATKFDFMATTIGDRVLRVTDGVSTLCYDFPEVGPNNLPAYETNLIGVTAVNGEINNAYVTALPVGGTSLSEQAFFLNGCSQRTTVFNQPLSLASFRDLAVDSTGNAVVSNTTGSDLWRLTPTSSYPISRSGLPVDNIGVLAFDILDNLFVASHIKTSTMQSAAIYMQVFGTSSWFPIAVLGPSVSSSVDILGMAIQTTDYRGIPFVPISASNIIGPYIMTRSGSSDRSNVYRLVDLNIDSSFFKIVGNNIVLDPGEIVEVAAIDAGIGLTFDSRENLIASVAETEGRSVIKLTDKNNDGDFKDANEYKVIFQSHPSARLKDIAFAPLCYKPPTPIFATSPPGGVGEIGVPLLLIGDGSLSPCDGNLSYEWTDEGVLPPRVICTTANCPYVCTGLPHLHPLGLVVTDSRGNRSPKAIVTIKCGPPKVNGFWPFSGVTNNVVFMFGKNFKVASGRIPTVCFNNGTLCTPLVQVVAPDLLLVFQPYGTTYGRITVTTDMGTASSSNYPIIDSGGIISGLWPSEIAVGGIVFVFGGQFSLSPGSNIVDVNGVPAPLVHVLDSGLILFVVPPGASTGPVHVTRYGFTSTSSFPLVILP